MNPANNHKDIVGNTYGTPDGKPAASGVDITIHGPQGPQAGKMIGGIATPNKNS